LVSPKATRLAKIIAATAGASGLLALTVWGIVRGYQIGFSAMLAQNPLGQFLAEHPVLSAIFYTFVTVATPLAGAAASIHAWRSLRAAHEWGRAHRAWQTLHEKEVQHTKDIEKAQGELLHVDTLAETRQRQWQAVLAQFYQRGQSHGARQESMISVIRKSGLACLSATPVFLLLGVVPAGVLAACPVVAGLGMFAWLSHRRIHPGHDRYLKLENTQYAVPDRGFVQVRPQTSSRLLTKGKE